MIGKIKGLETKMFSTDDFLTQTFRPHGRVESTAIGRIFVQHAKGPFNEQIVDAMKAVHGKTLSTLNSAGPWGAIFWIEDSALTNILMLKHLTTYLKNQKKSGSKSVGTAVVIGEDVEGCNMMAPLFVKAWTDADIVSKHFKTLEEGSGWVDGLLPKISGSTT